MADDIDDLLDEVETKYVEKKNNSAVASKRTKPKPRNELDDDINDILSDTHLDDDLSIQPQKWGTANCEIKGTSWFGNHRSFEAYFQVPTMPVRENSTQGSGQKCLQVYLGGSKHESGHGTAITQRTCDQLRCTACDFKVCQFNDYKWASDTNYLFLRNNVPNFEKLRTKLSPAKGQRAYCCQCCWRTFKDLTVLNDPELKWHCGKH